MADSSFDIVSKVDKMEADNAVNQARKEVEQRYDFKNIGASVEWSGEKVLASWQQLLAHLREQPRPWLRSTDETPPPPQQPQPQIRIEDGGPARTRARRLIRAYNEPTAQAQRATSTACDNEACSSPG